MISKSALVLGRFYPPHLGHHYLINFAAQNSERLLVLVLSNDGETIPLGDRMSWIDNDHAHQRNVQVVGLVDNVRTDYNDPDIWDQHMGAFNRVLRDYCSNHPIDTVYSSEPYGEELASRLGAIHTMVDEFRTHVPISATLIRANPLGHENMLSQGTIAGLTKRVVVLGAESTGTTTLVGQLQNHYRAQESTARTQKVDEYGHEYTTIKLLAYQAQARATRCPVPTMEDLEWTDDEFLTIACEQNRQEDLAANTGGLLLLCDTDAWTTGIWQRRYMGHVTSDVKAEARTDRALYIVTHDEGVDFEQDGTRDGEHLRSAMTAEFIEELTKAQANFIVVRGSKEQRLEQATAAIDQILSSNWWA